MTQEIECRQQQINLSHKYCIIGAGPSGLVSAKNLNAAGIPCEVLERHSKLGGIWNISSPWSSVYESTHTITSKAVTAYTDFPLPDDYPIYPHHTQILDYLNQYATHFDLHKLIRFNQKVVKITKDGDYWTVAVKGGEVRRYRGVIIANGHNWCPNYPHFPGEFSGNTLHSKDYDNPEKFRGKRVLIVGGGNTGCDIAVEASNIASKTFLSLRRGYYFVPKFAFGKPTDQIGQSSQSSRLPLGLVRAGYRLLLWLAVGRPQSYGLPKPDHQLLESPPIVNSLLPYHVAHGKITVKPDVEQLKGNTIQFQDGSIEEIDTVVYATGYRVVFPFIDKEHLNEKKGKPDFFMMAFHPTYNNLFIAGLTDGTGGHFPTVDVQTQVIACFIRGIEDSSKAAQQIEALKKNGNLDFTRGINFIDSDRSFTQFELATYVRYMKKMLCKLSRSEKAQRKTDEEKERGIEVTLSSPNSFKS